MTDFQNLPGIPAGELPGLAEGIVRLAPEPDGGVTCPSCEECDWFTLHKTGGETFARCQNCQHQIGVIIVSAVGLPMDGHIEPHFDEAGLCICPCFECTTRTAMLCACLDCPCERPEDHAAFAE